MRSQDFSDKLTKVFSEASGAFIEISSGKLHRLAGGYPGKNHCMAMCCSVMRSMMSERDEVVGQPPKKNGASLLVRYYLPRSAEKSQAPKAPVKNTNDLNTSDHRTIVLLSCAKTKRPTRSRAEDLYISPLFKKSLAYAKSLQPGKIFIMSAKHYLLELDELLEPYDETLNSKKEWELKNWSIEMLARLQKNSDVEKDEFIILAGEKYRRYLTPHLKNYTVPMAGMPLGRQLKFLGSMVRA